MIDSRGLRSPVYLLIPDSDGRMPGPPNQQKIPFSFSSTKMMVYSPSGRLRSAAQRAIGLSESIFYVDRSGAPLLKDGLDWNTATWLSRQKVIEMKEKEQGEINLRRINEKGNSVIIGYFSTT